MSEDDEKIKKDECDADLIEMQHIDHEVDALIKQILNDELTTLAKLSSLTGSLTAKLRAHYASIFPKTCGTCGTVYPTRHAYLAATQKLRKRTAIFDELGLQEYRNCACGSTLLIWSKDRRDRSEYGEARRELFQKCLSKIRQISSKPDAELQAELRQLFSDLSR